MVISYMATILGKISSEILMKFSQESFSFKTKILIQNLGFERNLLNKGGWLF